MSDKNQQSDATAEKDEADASGYTPLGRAVRDGDQAKAQRLARAGANPGAGFPSSTPLAEAAGRGQEIAAREMVDALERLGGAGARRALDATDAKGRPPLIAALDKGLDELAARIARAGANLRASHGGRGALPLAVKAGLAQAALAMIEISAAEPSRSCLNDTDESGLEALLCAIQAGREALGVALVEAGASMRCHSGGCFALPMAIKMGRRRTALSMIEMSKKSASRSCLNDRDELSDEALLCAIKKGEEDLAVALCEAGAELTCHSGGCSALPMAIKMGRRRTALAMISISKANRARSCLDERDGRDDEALLLDASDASGESAIFVALRHGRHVLAIALVEGGAKLGARDARGRSELGAAIEAGARGAALAMVRSGACGARAMDDVGTRGPEAIKAASKAGMHEVVLALAEKLGAPESKLADGSTVESLAALSRQELRKRGDERSIEAESQRGKKMFEDEEGAAVAVLGALASFGAVAKAARESLDSRAAACRKLKG